MRDVVVERNKGPINRKWGAWVHIDSDVSLMPIVLINSELQEKVVSYTNWCEFFRTGNY